jgi:hypothetical protein
MSRVNGLKNHGTPTKKPPEESLPLEAIGYDLNKKLISTIVAKVPDLEPSAQHLS